MLLTLDLCPASVLHTRMSRAARFTSVTIYLEAITAVAIHSEVSLSPAVFGPLAVVLAAQTVFVKQPVRLLVRDRLIRAYTIHLTLALAFIVLLWVGTPGGDATIVAVIMGALVVVPSSWPAIAAMREARRVRARIRGAADTDVLLMCLSFNPWETLGARVRSFGGGRIRWAAPWVAAVGAFGAAFSMLGLLLQALGIGAGGPSAVASALLAIWVFYRVTRQLKPRASHLRTRDRRPPVLVLREFKDDAVAFDTARTLAQSVRVSPSASFEHLFARELDRIGPTITVGRPGERLPPLGASRDYVADLDWRRAVGALIADAAVVVFVLGDSEHLLWELQTSVTARGTEGLLVIVPPLRDQSELAHRWEGFVRATRDVIGVDIPGALPSEPVLGFFVSGHDAVLIVGRARAKTDYRLALRLFGWLRRTRTTSAEEVRSAVGKYFPVARVSSAKP